MRDELKGQNADQPLLTPPTVPLEVDWRTKIELAKQARQTAQEQRKGKPLTFETRKVPLWKSR